MGAGLPGAVFLRWESKDGGSNHVSVFRAVLAEATRTRARSGQGGDGGGATSIRTGERAAQFASRISRRIFDSG